MTKLLLTSLLILNLLAAIYAESSDKSDLPHATASELEALFAQIWFRRADSLSIETTEYRGDVELYKILIRKLSCADDEWRLQVIRQRPVEMKLRFDRGPVYTFPEQVDENFINQRHVLTEADVTAIENSNTLYAKWGSSITKQIPTNEIRQHRIGIDEYCAEQAKIQAEEAAIWD